MKTLDDEIKFHLSKQGWYVGEAPIDIHVMKDHLHEDGIDPSIVCLSSTAEAGRCLACTDGNRITISESLAWGASYMQIKFAALHEYAHILFNHSGRDCHAHEYQADLWALKQLIGSGKYNKLEIMDAISIFGGVVNEKESFSHPSSKSRYKRLYDYLKRWVP